MTIKLPPITEEEQRWISDNPNTNDLVDWANDHATAAVELDRAQRPTIAPRDCLWARNGHQCCPTAHTEAEVDRVQRSKPVACLPEGWRITAKDDLFNTITIVAPNGYSAVTTSAARNPENVLRMLAQDLLKTAPQPAHTATDKALVTLLDYVERSTHWREGGATRHDAMLALGELRAAIPAPGDDPP